MSGTAQIGVTGLAVMGRNLARNFARNGYTVALHNRTVARTHELVEEFGDEGEFIATESAQDFVAALERPRRLVIMVKAGEATDAVIAEFAPLLETGDVIIDGGNAHFEDTRRRERELREQGIHFVGTGISGGEEGALEGPSIMPGGSEESYDSLGPMLEKISAKAKDGAPCVTHIGPDGAGHFVKMTHNGIEYADMQLIGEAYQLLRNVAGYSPAQIADIFRTWNTGRLDSYLIEITAEVLSHVDASTGKPFVDVVLDQAEQKGTGRWTVQIALDLGVPVSAIAEAVFARSVSGHADLRDASRHLTGPTARRLGADEAAAFADQVEQALYASKIVAYTQGFHEIAAEQRAVRLEHRPRQGRLDLARRMHHPGRVPRQDHQCLRSPAAAAQPPRRQEFRGGDRRRTGRLAHRDRHRRHPGRPHPGLRRHPRLLRLAPRRTPSRRPHPGPARLLRRTHLPPHRPRGHVPHPLGRRPDRGQKLTRLRKSRLVLRSIRTPLTRSGRGG